MLNYLFVMTFGNVCEEAKAFLGVIPEGTRKFREDLPNGSTTSREVKS
jgi:hypothetical protein